MPEVTYVGTCTTLEEKKGGWFRIHIAVPGKQYPVKPETKLEHLIAKAREIRDAGLVATWTVEEYDSENINPKSGQPYTERRLNGVEEGAPAGTNQAAAVQQPEPHHEAVHFADKDRLISRQVCLKVAGSVFMGQGVAQLDPPSSAAVVVPDVPLAVMKAAQRFERWLYRDIDPAPSSSGTDAAPVSQPAENTPAPDPDPGYSDDWTPPLSPGDDDIPF